MRLKKQSKYKPAFAAKAKLRLEEKESQKKLHQKYNIEDDIKIIEKSGFVKSVRTVIRWMAILMIFFLAFCGACALIYPAPRQNLYTIFQDAFNFFMEQCMRGGSI